MRSAHSRDPARPLQAATAVLTLAAGLGLVLAQGPGPSPVRYTEAKEYPVRGTIRLPGTAESGTVSLVASEVEGLVVKLHVHEGDTARKGQPLAQLRTANLDLRLEAANAQLKEAESRLKLAELNLARVRELFESEVASQQELDTASYEHTSWQGRVEGLTAEIGRIKLALSQSTIKAPFAGLVAVERTEIGQWIPVGGPIVEMMALDELEVRVDVPEQHFTSLNPGAVASVTFQAIPGFRVDGKITTVVPRADPKSRSFPMKVRVPNKDGRIGVGMLAQVSFPGGSAYRATVVPKDAVVRQGEGEFVFLINGEDKVERVAVQTGQGVGSWVVVEGEIRAGQKVVTRGNERLWPGAAVKGEALEYELP